MHRFRATGICAREQLAAMDANSLPLPDISAVIPVKDEAGNIEPLVSEIVAALSGRMAFEIIYVDDGSRDETPATLAALKSRVKELRVLRHKKNCGQSAAVRSGVMAARSPLIVTLDGDGQNVPADIPLLVDAFRRAQGRIGLVGGRRTKRQDTFFKRIASKAANGIRRRLLRDKTADSGSGLKLFSREAYLRLPYFDHMHRFLPALMMREGFEVSFVDVQHRPRTKGQSKYGVFDRLWVSISDILGVMWLIRRGHVAKVTQEL